MAGAKTVAVFGDVHGESDKLNRLIKKINREYPGSELYSVGDLVDRGPNSKEVIDICIGENVKAVMGNHEEWLVNLSVSKVFDSFCLSDVMSGWNTIASYGISRDYNGDVSSVAMEMLEAIYLSNHNVWYANLPLYRKIVLGGETFWITHSGVKNAEVQKCSSSLSQDELMETIVRDYRESITWSSPRLGSTDNLYEFKDAMQIFGHRPVQRPEIKSHYAAIDTGCGTCHPDTLTAIILPEKNIIQVT